MNLNLTSIGAVIAVIAGLGTIIAGVGFVLDMFYVPRSEFNISQQAYTKTLDKLDTAYTKTLDKLDTLEFSLTNLTKIFLRGEISNLNRVIDELEAIENRSDVENDYLFRLKNDVTDLKIQLNAL